MKTATTTMMVSRVSRSGSLDVVVAPTAASVDGVLVGGAGEGCDEVEGRVAEGVEVSTEVEGVGVSTGVESIEERL